MSDTDREASALMNSEPITRLQRVTTTAFLLLTGAVLLAGAVTFWQCLQLPSLGLAWTLDEGIVNVVQPSGPANGVLREGDRLRTLNGLPFVPAGDMGRISHAVRPGQPAEVVVIRDGTTQVLTITPAAMDLTLEGHLIDYVGGLLLIGLGLYVFLRRPQSTSGRSFLLLSLMGALSLWGNVSLFVDPWYAALRRLALSVLVPCLFIGLIVSLPYDRWSRGWLWRWHLGYCLLSLGLGLAGAVAALLVNEWNIPLYQLILGNQALGLVIAVGFFVLIYRQLPRGAVRDHYRGAVTFLFLGALPLTIVVTLALWQGLRTFEPRLAAVAALTEPVAMAYVVLRYPFLGVRVVVRQALMIGLMLGVTTAVLLIAYILAYSLLSLVMIEHVHEASLLVATLVAAALFEPARRYIHRHLEYRLDRRSVELYAALQSFGRELAALRDLPSLLDSLTHQLETLFPHTCVLIVLRTDEDPTYRVVRHSAPAGDVRTLAFAPQGALAQRLRRGDVLLPHQWAEALEHLPPAERRLAEGLQPEIVIPLLARRDELLGWIALGAPGGHSSYDEREIAWLVSLANQASIAIANAQAYDQTARMVRQLQESNRQLLALQGIGASLTGRLPLEEVLQRVVQGLLNSGDYTTAALGVTNEARTAIELTTYCRTDARLQTQIEELVGDAVEGLQLAICDEQHPLIQAIKQGQVWKIHSLPEDFGPAFTLAHPTWDLTKATRLQQLGGEQTYVLLPLCTNQDLLGLLIVGTTRPDVPGPEIDVLRTFAYQATLAIENARLWGESDEQLRQRVRELTTLHTIAEAVNSTLDLDEVLDRALKHTLSSTRFDAGLIALLDEGGRLTPTVSHQVAPAVLEFLTHLPPSDVQQLIHAPPAVVDDIQQVSPSWNRSLLRDAGLQAFCFVPLISRDDPVGVLGLGLHQGRSLTEEDLSLTRAVAQQVSIAIANARLYEAAAEEKQKTEIILQSVGDGVCTTDRDLTVLSLNPAAARLLGWQEHEAIGQHCGTVLQCHDAQEVALCETDCPLRVAMQRRRYEYPRLGAAFVRARNGQRVPIWSVAGPLTDPAGTVLGGVLAFRDASREAEMERLQNEFMSMISHEVRTPLTNLKAAAQTIIRLGDRQDAETRANLARIIAAQCDRLDQLVQSVEDSAQLEASRLDLQITSFHLPPLVRDLVQLFQVREPRRAFSVLAADEPALWVLGDAAKIGMVLNNLLDNAVKYSRPQGAIMVRLSLRDPDQVLVAVIDEGPSIPADQRELIFQRFYRIDNSDSRAVYGLGLGLYIARSLVRALNGQIWVDEEYRPGNQFCFTLPRGTPPYGATDSQARGVARWIGHAS